MPAASLDRILRRLGRAIGAPVHALMRFIGPASITDPAASPAVHLDWLLGLSVYAAICILAARGMPETAPAAGPLFWTGTTLLFFGFATRIAAPTVARAERVWLLMVLAEATFALKYFNDPAGFLHFDEFLHWQSAEDILTEQRLFVPNSMLPVSPLYPGLELVTTALVSLSGLSVFAAANIVMMISRAVFIAGLFAFFERISGSARLAGIGCVAYMGSSGYVLFDSQFAYESLAVALMAVVLMAQAELDATRASLRRTLAIIVPLFAALALTHHVTDYFTVAFVCALALLQIAGRGRERLSRVGFAACAAVATAVIWAQFIDNPTTDYLAPMLVEGTEQLAAMLRGAGPQRKFFELNEDVIPTPRWLQLEGIAAVLILAGLLANGFFTSCARARGQAGRTGWLAVLDLLQGRWDNSRLLLVTLLAFAWPVSMALRMTSAGWQVGNRMNAFAFIGAGMVAAFSIARLWRAPRQWPQGMAAGLALGLVATGGVISGWGVAAVRTQYKVEGDALSIEPMAIDAAEWTRQWLGSGNGFAADRDNRVLLATYGRQRIVTRTFEDASTAYLFVAPTVWSQLTGGIRQERIDYILVDMRMTTQRPYLNMFFQEGEPPEIRTAPLDPEPLQKWDREPGVSRVFDDGWIRIYDIRGLQDAP